MNSLPLMIARAFVDFRRRIACVGRKRCSRCARDSCFLKEPTGASDALGELLARRRQAEGPLLGYGDGHREALSCRVCPFPESISLPVQAERGGQRDGTRKLRSSGCRATRKAWPASLARGLRIPSRAHVRAPRSPQYSEPGSKWTVGNVPREHRALALVEPGSKEPPVPYRVVCETRQPMLSPRPLMLVCLLAACATDIPEGVFTCSRDPNSNLDCPRGWSCQADLLCYRAAVEVEDAIAPSSVPDAGEMPDATSLPDANLTDAETPPPQPTCASAGQRIVCNDGRFCNGEEFCDPSGARKPGHRQKSRQRRSVPLALQTHILSGDHSASQQSVALIRRPNELGGIGGQC
jgi:hypothetical protein